MEDEAQFPTPEKDPKENTGRFMVDIGGWWLVGPSTLHGLVVLVLRTEHSCFACGAKAGNAVIITLE